MPSSLTAKIAGFFAMIKQWDQALWNEILIALVIFLVFWLFSKLLSHRIPRLIARWGKSSDTELGQNLGEAFRKPLQYFLIILGAYFALKYLPLKPSYDLAVIKLFRTGVIILTTFGFYNLAGSYDIIGDGFDNLFGIKFDKILIPFLSKALRVIIIGLGFSIIAGEWDYDVNGFVAGLGLGGLAFALAAQDTAANIFGGIVIITDKPFDIGDWIQTPSIEGMIEDINFRSTRIRTFNQALVTVPNSTLAKEPITNRSKMGKRRISFTLPLTYDTPKDNLERAVDSIRQMLEGHPGIHQETIFVRLDGFGERGFEVLLYFFTKTVVWGEHLQVKEDINYRILEILEREGVSIALPSTSLYFPSGETGEIARRTK